LIPRAWSASNPREAGAVRLRSGASVDEALGCLVADPEAKLELALARLSTT
jgi:hypothetical protein